GSEIPILPGFTLIPKGKKIFEILCFFRTNEPSHSPPLLFFSEELGSQNEQNSTGHTFAYSEVIPGHGAYGLAIAPRTGLASLASITACIRDDLRWVSDPPLGG